MKLTKVPNTLGGFISLFLKRHAFIFCILLILVILTGTMPPVDTILLKYAINHLSNIPFYAQNTAYVKVGFELATVFCIWWTIVGAIWRLYEYFSMKLFPRMKYDIIESLFAYTEEHPIQFFQESFSGGISSRITELGENVIEVLTISTEKLLRKFFTVVFTFITLYTIKPLISAVFIAWIGILVFMNMLLASEVNDRSMNQAHAKTIAFSKIVDSISNIINVKLFGRHEYEKVYLKKYLLDAEHKGIAFEWFLIRIRSLESILSASYIGIVLAILTKLYQQNLVSVGDIALVITLSGAVAEHIWLLTQELGDFEKAVGACNQALATLSQEHDVHDAPIAEKLVVTKGEIVFDKVDFNHTTANMLFNNLTVTIPGKQKVGLVGYSGSGKTTFINLIVRLYDIDSGTITIDGQNIAHVTHESLCDSVGIIPQNPQMFHRSIKENIAYGKPDATDEQIIDAAKKAYAHEFIMQTQAGYDTLAGEHGLKLSGGQVQRIAIARAILKNAPILILDEATSALDSVTEAQLQESFSFVMQDKTALIIAHRISTLLSMDRIIVFNKGVITEDGNHESLLKLDGMYAKLWNSQVNGFLVGDE